MDRVERVASINDEPCDIFHLELGDWPRPEVHYPRTKAFSQYIQEQETKGRGEALGAARQRLAERVVVREEKRSLRTLRLITGLSQAALAKAIGTSQPRIARLEAGREEPGLTTLRKLASALNTDINTVADAFQ